MKKLHSKMLNKLIITIIAVIMLCNFVMPKISYAVSTENGGSGIEPISKFLCFIADVTNNLLQHTFVSPYNIKDGDEYKFLYSPGIIFSGNVPAFDIDFIGTKDHPSNVVESPDIEYNLLVIIPEEDSRIYRYGTDGQIVSISNSIVRLKLDKDLNTNTYNNIEDAMADFIQNGKIDLKDGSKIKISTEGKMVSDYYYTNKMVESLQSILKGYGIKWTSNSKWEIINSTDSIGAACKSPRGDENGKTSGTIEGDDPKFLINGAGEKTLRLNLSDVVYNGETHGVEIEYRFIKHNIDVSDQNQGTYSGYSLEGHMGKNNTEVKDKVYKSSAAILQPIVATWYKALRRIALVGLLSVLVYLGIKIVTTSSSAKDKAKYKKMLKDWLIAICLLFVLHYIMSLTIMAVNRINSIIGASATGKEGEDLLMSSLRNRIGQAGSWGSAISEVIIYNVMTVFAIIYTIQYVRRVIYLAFLTMIAPLITLTYPLDKIKDSKAQAFDTWLKDYIFFTLIQVVHLLLYYIFLSESLDLANRGHWIYAIVAIGFMTKAEKIMKEMFGFKKSKSIGALSAGATGALVMNAINKISHAVPHGNNGSKKGTGSSGTRNTNTRTRTNYSLLAGIQEMVDNNNMPHDTGDGTGGEGDLPTEPPQDSPPNTPPGGSDLTDDDTGEGENTRRRRRRKRRLLTSDELADRRANSTTDRRGTRNNSFEKTISGVAAVYKRYGRPIVRGAAGITTGAMGGAIGFGAGASTGEIPKAATGTIVGATAGYYTGQRLINTGESVIHTVTHPGETIDNIKQTIRKPVDRAQDTFYRVTEGKEAMKEMKTLREIKRSPAYIKLRETNPNFTEASIQKMIRAGIKDPKRMDRILKNNARDPHRYSIDLGIAYSTLAKECPDDVLANNRQFIRFCSERNIRISPEEVKELRKNIIEFK